MAKSNVLKILYVFDMLKRTDENHPINTTQIIENLMKAGFEKAERKAIGNYITILRDEMDYDIILCDNKNLGWYMVNQEFEDYELKMLCDAVSSAKFLTANSTNSLIKKIRKQATVDGDRIIKAGLVVDDSLKMSDSKFTLKFDTIMRAIADGKQITFQYETIGSGGEKIPKYNGRIYEVSPYYLGIWKHEYFVIANTNPHDNVSPYHLSLMTNVKMTDKKIKPMSEVEQLKKINKNGRTFGDFLKESVNLFTNNVKSIDISGINILRPEVVKKFGSNITFINQGDDRFKVRINASDSLGFYQWIAGFGNSIKIDGPDECIDGFKQFLKDALEQY